MGLVQHAESELKRLTRDDEEKDEMQERMNRHILKMVETFAEEGHSGFSAKYALNILDRLLRYKPLLPLTGEDDEWEKVDGKGLLQNKRCSAVFKYKDGKAKYIEGKVFSNDGGETWYTDSDSHVEIAFPFNVPIHPEYIILPKAEESEEKK